MNDRYYTSAHAEAILRVAFANSDGKWRDGAPPKTRDPESTSRIYIDQRGVWPNFGDDDVLGWKPCWELVDIPQPPDCSITAGLPFPFTEYQLAAWMQSGVGALVASCFGRWKEGPDTSLLNHPDDNTALEAVKGVFELCRKAMGVVGNEPELRHVKKATASERALRQVTPLSARLHAQWLRSMVQQLLCGGDVSTWDMKARASFLSGFYGDDLDAKTWASLPVVDSSYAALLLSGINPARHPDPEHGDLPEGRVIAFRLCLAALSSVAKDGQDRTLKDWVAVAGDLCPQVEIDVRVLVALRSVEDLTVGSVFVGAPVETATPETPSEPLPEKSKGSSRRGWFEVTSAFIAKVRRDGKHSTGKELFRALEDGAGTPASPFDKGEGNHRGSLYVREIGKPLALKTLQNNMGRLRDLAGS